MHAFDQDGCLNAWKNGWIDGRTLTNEYMHGWKGKMSSLRLCSKNFKLIGGIGSEPHDASTEILNKMRRDIGWA